jgi:hypothetical protein
MVKSSLTSILDHLHSNIQRINESKVFAGLMIITLNIVSKYVNIGLSKTMESYLKYTFSRQLLVFSIAWMGTRDIYIALFITLVFSICTEYLFNEDSVFCILSEDFRDYHSILSENDKNNAEKVTDEEIKKANEILEKAKKQNKVKDENFEGFSMK